MSRFIKSFGFALNGIVYAFKTQPNFKYHCALTILAVTLGWYYRLNNSEWLWIMVAVAMVLISELLNTAIEILVDLVSPTYNKKAGLVKDTAAAAVLIAAIIAAAIGLIIFVPKFL
ncbi:diacylglycerol kinase [Pedobacter sp. CG_S7]|uniref:diacylglycerol kinase family protein n=1 Tax=Pedobacter sp. CG_S7 TaxID=3143930 RepID=UPI003393F287